MTNHIPHERVGALQVPAGGTLVVEPVAPTGSVIETFVSGDVFAATVDPDGATPDRTPSSRDAEADRAGLEAEAEDSDVRPGGPQKGAGGGIDRRSFIKGVVSGAVVGAAGASAVAGLGWLGGSVQPEASAMRYSGAKVLVGSPTDHGLPLVPLRVDRNGYVLGRPDDLRPFLYCARDREWPGGDSAFGGDDHLRYHIPEGRLVRYTEEEARTKWWFYDLLGKRVHVDHFAARPSGDGALFSWRDPDTERPGFVGVLIKIPRGDIVAEGEGNAVLRASALDGDDLVAYDAACTHFCCPAGWHESETAKKLGYWETIFCDCHNARFDPRRIETYSFVWDQGLGR